VLLGGLKTGDSSKGTWKKNNMPWLMLIEVEADGRWRRGRIEKSHGGGTKRKKTGAWVEWEMKRAPAEWVGLQGSNQIAHGYEGARRTPQPLPKPKGGKMKTNQGNGEKELPLGGGFAKKTKGKRGLPTARDTS